MKLAVIVNDVGLDCVGIMSDWRAPATANDADASSCPNAGIASTFNACDVAPVPLAAVPTMPATWPVHVDNWVVVNGVGVAVGWHQSDALKPGKTWLGNAMIKSFEKN